MSRIHLRLANTPIVIGFSPLLGGCGRIEPDGTVKDAYLPLDVEAPTTATL
jgi:hypothetical protein